MFYQPQNGSHERVIQATLHQRKSVGSDVYYVIDPICFITTLVLCSRARTELMDRSLGVQSHSQWGFPGCFNYVFKSEWMMCRPFALTRVLGRVPPR